MDPIDEDIGINNGDKAVLLADVGVVRQVVCSLVDDVVGGGDVCHIDAEGRVPLDELGPGCENSLLTVFRLLLKTLTWSIEHGDVNFRYNYCYSILLPWSIPWP